MAQTLNPFKLVLWINHPPNGYTESWHLLAGNWTDAQAAGQLLAEARSFLLAEHCVIEFAAVQTEKSPYISWACIGSPLAALPQWGPVHDDWTDLLWRFDTGAGKGVPRHFRSVPDAEVENDTWVRAPFTIPAGPIARPLVPALAAEDDLYRYTMALFRDLTCHAVALPPDHLGRVYWQQTPWQHCIYRGVSSWNVGAAYERASWEPRDFAEQPGFTPCGTVVTALRTFYEQECRFFSSGPVQGIRYYRASPGAIVMPHRTIFWGHYLAKQIADGEPVGESKSRSSYGYNVGLSWGAAPAIAEDGTELQFLGQTVCPWGSSPVTPGPYVIGCDMPAPLPIEVDNDPAGDQDTDCQHLTFGAPLILSNVGTNHDRVDLAAAAHASPGYVSLDNQDLGAGAKAVETQLVVGGVIADAISAGVVPGDSTQGMLAICGPAPNITFYPVGAGTDEQQLGTLSCQGNGVWTGFFSELTLQAVSNPTATLIGYSAGFDFTMGDGSYTASATMGLNTAPSIPTYFRISVDDPSHPERKAAFQCNGNGGQFFTMEARIGGVLGAAVFDGGIIVSFTPGPVPPLAVARGGVRVGGAFDMSRSHVEAHAGGVEVGGQESHVIAVALALAGGVQVGGEAVVNGIGHYAYAGGVQVGGQESHRFVAFRAFAGGVEVGGTEAHVVTDVETFSGGVQVGGTESHTVFAVETFSGGVQVGGTFSNSFTPGADSEALTFSGSGAILDGPFAGYVLGWEFSISTTITVTKLGWFQAISALAQNHDVGIWDNSGTLLCSATVLTSDTRVDSTGSNALSGFRYHAITPCVLTAGTYRIGGLNPSGSSDQDYDYVVTITPDSRISYIHGYYVGSATLARPTAFGDREKGYFGPSFMFH